MIKLKVFSLSAGENHIFLNTFLRYKRWAILIINVVVLAQFINLRYIVVG